MKRGYLKNAVLLCTSDLILRLAGMGFRIYLARVLGGEGMGLYQLVLAFYAVFVTLATSGVSVASTRLVTEEMTRSAGEARGMLHRLIVAALVLGGTAGALQYTLAGVAARYWLGDVRAVSAIRAASAALPFMALGAVLRGFFIARRRVEANVYSQLAEQSFRIVVVVWALRTPAGQGLAVRCGIVMAGTAASEALSTSLMVLFYAADRRRTFRGAAAQKPRNAVKRLWDILWPVEGGRCLSSAMHSAENMLVPACLAVFLADAGGRAAAVAQYGVLKGMALPLLFFPFGLLGSLATLLMPEITQTHVEGQTQQLRRLLDRMLTLTMGFSALAGAAFAVCGRGLAVLLYRSTEAGFYIEVLAPVMPFMYLESMVDGAMKGLGEQKASFRYSVWDSVLRIGGAVVLLPRFGMKGFLFIMLCSNLYTCLMNTRRLIVTAGLRVNVPQWILLPFGAACAAAAAGLAVRCVLPQGTLWPLIGGGAALATVYSLLEGCFGCGPLLWELARERTRKAKKEETDEKKA